MGDAGGKHLNVNSIEFGNVELREQRTGWHCEGSLSGSLL